MKRGIREAPRFGNNIETKSARNLEKGDRNAMVVEGWLLMVPTKTRQELKSNLPTLEISTMRKEINKSVELVEGTKVIHEIRGGRVSRNDLVPRNFLPTLGKEMLKKDEHKKETKGGMQWEKSTPQGENPMFVFKIKQSPSKKMGQKKV